MNYTQGSSLLAIMLATALLTVFITTSWRVAQFSVRAAQSYGFFEQIRCSTEGLLLFGCKLVKNNAAFFCKKGRYAWTVPEWPVGNGMMLGNINIHSYNNTITIQVHLVDPKKPDKKFPHFQAVLIREQEQILCTSWSCGDRA